MNLGMPRLRVAGGGVPIQGFTPGAPIVRRAASRAEKKFLTPLDTPLGILLEIKVQRRRRRPRGRLAGAGAGFLGGIPTVL